VWAEQRRQTLALVVDFVLAGAGSLP